MSAETRQAMETAIAAHVADEKPGHLLVDFVTVVRVQNLDNDLSHFKLIVPETQSFHITDGLTSIGRRLVADIWRDPDA